MEYVVYCDESRQDCGRNAFMAIGSLWFPRYLKDDATRQLRDLRRSLCLNAEVKWRKVSHTRLDAYRKLVDFFFEHDEMRFRTIVVDQRKVDAEKFHGGDVELGFYKFYYEMLVKWLHPDNQYLILLDFKKNKGADRYKTLRTYLERAVKGKAWVSDLTVIDSAQSPLAQLCDLLTGAVAASWCDDVAAGSAKASFAAYIAEKCGYTSLRTESVTPALSKFNIFRIQLQGDGKGSE